MLFTITIGTVCILLDAMLLMIFLLHQTLNIVLQKCLP
jgi:hypothetical protein